MLWYCSKIHNINTTKVAANQTSQFSLICHTGDLTDVTSTQDWMHLSICQPSLLVLQLRVNDISNPSPLSVCVGRNGFSTGVMRALKECPPPVISAVSRWGCHLHVNKKHPESTAAAHPSTGKKFNIDGVLIEWGPCIDSLRHVPESLSQNGWIRSSHLANHAGYRRLRRRGEGWRNERARPSVPEIPRGNIAAAYHDRNSGLQSLMPWH